MLFHMLQLPPVLHFFFLVTLLLSLLSCKSENITLTLLTLKDKIRYRCGIFMNCRVVGSRLRC